MRILEIVFLCFLIAVHLSAAESRHGEQGLEIGSTDQARLEQAEILLDDAEAANRLSAVQMIVHQAGRGATMSRRLEVLLLRATADPDPEIAALAARALERREHPPEPDSSSDDEIRARADASRLRWAGEILSRTDPDDRSASDRLAAAHILVHLASRKVEWEAELEWAIREARRSDDRQIAHLAEKVLARHEARAMHPDFAWSATPSQEPSEPSLESQKRADAMYAGAAAPDPQVRLSSLHRVVDIALAEGADSDRRILDTLIAHRSDPDPRIAHFVQLALDGLAGDESAMRGVVDMDP